MIALKMVRFDVDVKAPRGAGDMRRSFLADDGLSIEMHREEMRVTLRGAEDVKHVSYFHVIDWEEKPLSVKVETVSNADISGAKVKEARRGK